MKELKCSECGINGTEKPIIILPVTYICYDCYIDQESLAGRVKKLEKRLQAAENFIHLSPSNPDITTEQWKAYHKWLALGGKQ